MLYEEEFIWRGSTLLAPCTRAIKLHNMTCTVRFAQVTAQCVRGLLALLHKLACAVSPSKNLDSHLRSHSDCTGNCIKFAGVCIHIVQLFSFSSFPQYKNGAYNNRRIQCNINKIIFTILFVFDYWKHSLALYYNFRVIMQLDIYNRLAYCIFSTM